MSTRHTAPLMFVAGALVAAAMAVLIAQNRESTRVEWLGWDPTGPMWIVLLLAFGAGVVVGPVVIGAIALARHRRSVHGMVIGALLIAGFFTFPFNRLLGAWLFR